MVDDKETGTYTTKTPMSVEQTDPSVSDDLLVTQVTDSLTDADKAVQHKTRVLQAQFATEQGYYHDTNEDLAGFNEFFFGVADGVGGGAYGDLASQVMIDTCKHYTDWKSKEQIQSILEVAQNNISEYISQKTNKRGGCAFAGVWLDNETGNGYYTWVGDVRIYHIYPDSRPERQQEGLLVRCLTVDQTYENMNETSPSGNQDNLARLVGFDTMGTPDINSIHLNEGEFILIMCDGIHNFVPYQQLQAECQQLLQAEVSLHDFCKGLVRKAKLNNSHDDCTALIIGNHTEVNQAFDKSIASATVDEPQTMSMLQVAHLTQNWKSQSADTKQYYSYSEPDISNNQSDSKLNIQIIVVSFLFAILGILIGISGVIDSLIELINKLIK